MNEHYNLYKTELLDRVMPFWSKHSIDHEHGGYFSCLLRNGDVFDQDKFIWLQARQLWMYATLHQQLEPKQEWLNIAQHGADFLTRHGRDASGNWYFSLNGAGKPLVQPYNIFSDCFAAMAFAAFYKIKEDEQYAEIARTTFANILSRRENPKGKYEKHISATRNLKNFSLPMILCNLSLEMEHLLDKAVVENLIDEIIEEVMEVFYDKASGLMMENVNADGSFSNSFEGRLLNPGHTIEAMWFIMDLGVRKQDDALIERAAEIAIRSLEHGWDEKFGGLFYFMDCKGYPPQQLEWDQKLWWVHIESLICMAKAYQLTEKPKAKHWFEKLHAYTWKHFKDPEHAEWYGYLKRDGQPLSTQKGGKWKGCFHVPRGLFQIMQTLEKMNAPVNYQKNHTL